MRRKSVGAVAALALVAVVGCQRGEPCRPRNLVLISVDTLRADHLGTYGYERPTSPFIDELASRGVVFERAYTTATWTVPSHASMLTGLYPRHHGMRRGGKEGRTAIPTDVDTLAEVLQRSGYATMGLSNMLYLSTRNGFHRGFDSWTEIGAAVGAQGSMPALTFRAMDWIDEHREEPFFLFLHVYDVHSAYRPLPRYREMFVGAYDGPAFRGDEKPLVRHRRGQIELGEADAQHLINLYDAEIRQFDAGLKRLFALLAEAGVLDDTVVLLTADHGEEFLDHGDFLHGRTLYDELARIPWIMVGPCLPEGVRVREPVSLVDVLPTSLGLLGVEHEAEIDGVDVSDSWTGSAEGVARPVFLEADEWIGSQPRDFRRAVVQGDRKLHLDGRSGRVEVYDLAQDPGEQRDLGAEAGADLDTQLREFLATPERQGPSIPPPTTKTMKRLRALGYVD